jgi:hypothetical protein
MRGLLSVALFLPAVGAAEPVSAELLAKLAAHGDRIEKVQRQGGYTLTSRSQQFDGDGKVTKVSETVIRLRGGVETRIRATEDGKDVTVAPKPQVASGEKKETVTVSEELSSPFEGEGLKKHRFDSLGPDANAGGLLRIRFEPAAQKGKDTLIGEALVDPVAGELVWWTFRPAKYPDHVEHLQVTQELHTVTRAGRMPSKIETHVTIGFFLLKMRQKEVQTLTDYVLPGAT